MAFVTGMAATNPTYGLMHTAVASRSLQPWAGGLAFFPLWFPRREDPIVAGAHLAAPNAMSEGATAGLGDPGRRISC